MTYGVARGRGQRERRRRRWRIEPLLETISALFEMVAGTRPTKSIGLVHDAYRSWTG